MGFKPTLSKFEHIEPILSCDFAIYFPDFPELGYHAATVELPGTTVDRVRAELYGKSREWPGRVVSSHTLPMTFLYDRKSLAFRILHALLQSAVEPNTGERKGTPFTIIVEQYDAPGVLVSARKYTNCWVSEISGYSLDAAAGDQAVMIPVVFGYEQQRISFGASAIASPIVPTTEPIIIGSLPRSIIAEFEQLIATGPTSIGGLIRTGQEALAFGRAVAGVTSQIAKQASNVLQQARTNPLNAISSAKNLVSQTKSSLKSFF